MAPLALLPAEPASLSVALDHLKARMAKPPAYQATLATQEWAGSVERHSRFSIIFKPPDRTRTTIVESNEWPQGTVVTTGGGGRPRVRMPGFLSWIAFELPPRDERSRTENGMFAEEVTPAAFARLTLDDRARRSVAGVAALGPFDVIVTELGGVPLPGGMVHAEVGLAWPTGDVIMGRLWRSGRNAYEYQVRDLVARDVADSELTP